MSAMEPSSTTPIDALLVLTYRCNSRCAMCGIWKANQSGRVELIADDYARSLPQTLLDVNLTGGEVFLRADLPDIVQAVRRAAPSARLVISSNGLLPGRVRIMLPSMLAAAPDLGFAISIDGREATHDRIRGIDGSWRRAMETVRILRDAGVDNLRLAFTASSTPVTENTSELGYVFELARRLGIEFTCAVAHNSDHYFKTRANCPINGDALTEQLEPIMRNELRGSRAKGWKRAYFYHSLIQYVRTGARPTPCEAGYQSFMLDPFGNVFPCNVLDYPVGNSRISTFEQIWRSPPMDAARREVRRCNKCWMVCTVRAEMRRDHAHVMTWIASRKARAHLGLPIL